MDYEGQEDCPGDNNILGSKVGENRNRSCWFRFIVFGLFVIIYPIGATRLIPLEGRGGVVEVPIGVKLTSLLTGCHASTYNNISLY